MPITLSAEEKEILQVGQEFAKLQNSPAYEKLLEWLESYVNEAQGEMEDILAKPSADPYHVAFASARWVDRKYVRMMLLGRVTEIVEQARKLAEEIAKESEEANV